MSQVMYTMRRKLPEVTALLEQIGAIREQLRSVSIDEGRQVLTTRLDQLCAGADPDEAVSTLQAFQSALEAGQGLQAAKLWVQLAPYLRAKGA